MHLTTSSIILRGIEARDLDLLYTYKNDPLVVESLGGFSAGYTREGLSRWMTYHADRADECLWCISATADDRCLGHVGFYQIDHRVQAAEFAIMIGASDHWRQGIGRAVTRLVVDYGFAYLNLNRIHISVLATNAAALAMYNEIGFCEEGRLRQAQYKKGAFIDVVLMGLLRDDVIGTDA